MDPPCCEPVKKHGIPDQVLVCSRQAETEVGLEEESLIAGLWTTSPAPYLYERTAVTERDMLPIDPPPKFVRPVCKLDRLVRSVRRSNRCVFDVRAQASGLVPDNYFTYVSTTNSTYVITRRVSRRARKSSRNGSSTGRHWKKYVTFLCFRRLLASTTSCYTRILCRPAPLRSNSCLSQGIGTPTEQFVALLWVNELLYLTNLELSIFLNNGEDHHTILVELVTV